MNRSKCVLLLENITSSSFRNLCIKSFFFISEKNKRKYVNNVQNNSLCKRSSRRLKYPRNGQCTRPDKVAV